MTPPTDAPRMMTQEEVETRLKVLLKPLSTVAECEAFADVRSHIAALEQRGRWIPVEEQTPEEGRPLDIGIEWGRSAKFIERVTDCWYNEGGFYYSSTSDDEPIRVEDKVICWQYVVPLPPPPAAGEK